MRTTTTTTSTLKLKPLLQSSDEDGARHGAAETGSEHNLPSKGRVLDLGDGSEVMYMPKFLAYEDAWTYFDYLNKHIPWTRPTIRVFGRSSPQPRDVCYIAEEGLPNLIYSGFQPYAHSWEEFPPLKDILATVLKALPGSSFNSLLLNRYKGGSDYVSWHADDEKVYGPAPEIASVSFGCEREFLLKRKPQKGYRATSMVLSTSSSSGDEPPSKRSKKITNLSTGQHVFTLKHGSLLAMRGYTQRDWLHSVPKRMKAESIRINLTFRLVVSST